MIHGYKFNIFNPEVFNLDPKRDWYLSGHWQNLQYFDWNKEELKKVFDFRWILMKGKRTRGRDAVLQLGERTCQKGRLHRLGI